MKYAIQILFDGGWLYVMDDDGHSVLTFDSHHEAASMADIWRGPKHEFVKVVEYK